MPQFMDEYGDTIKLLVASLWMVLLTIGVVKSPSTDDFKDELKDKTVVEIDKEKMLDWFDRFSKFNTDLAKHQLWLQGNEKLTISLKEETDLRMMELDGKIEKILARVDKNNEEMLRLTAIFEGKFINRWQRDTE